MLSRIAAGKVDVLVATDLAARGLDVSSITHVINFDTPSSLRSYLHRIGVLTAAVPPVRPRCGW